MNVPFQPLRWAVLWSAMAGFTGPPQAAAQDSLPAPVPGAAVTQSSHTTAQAEAGEPRADTSTQAPSNAPLAHDSAAPADSPPASRTQRGSAAVRASGAGQKPTAADRLELGTATVTGDREQPKVMYIVPWKKSDIGDLSGKPMNSLLDEALAPVDRDEFRREVVYYQAVKADASQNGASRSPAKQGEK